MSSIPRNQRTSLPAIPLTAALLLAACALPAPHRFAVPPGAAPTAAAQEPAQPAAGGDADLAKKLANPVSDLISLPLQNNWDFDAGPNDDGRSYRLNIQPVIPLQLNDDWNLITRTIVPVVDQHHMFPGDDIQSGLGDILASQFFSPRSKPGELIWGAGPVWLLPTATDDLLGAEKWGLGPSAVVLQQDGPWTYGALANHVWSFAGDDNRSDVSLSFLQPFLVYTFPSATGVGINTESSYNWQNHDWTVPINVFVAQVVRFGKLPLQIQLGGRYYAEGPDGAPEWGLRLQFTLLLPK